jgi:hypothetical protein
MAAPSKQTSRWGSFLQQAVAGVESRLDNILAEGADEAVPPSKKPAPSTPPVTTVKAEAGACGMKTSTINCTVLIHGHRCCQDWVPEQ